MEKKLKPIPKFVPDTCKNEKGHGNAMLDSTFETKEERDLMGRILDRLIIQAEKE